MHHVFTPLMTYPGFAVRSAGLGGGDLDVGHVAAVVGLGHGDGGHRVARGELGQPVLLLLLGAALDERPGEDLGAGDQRPTDPETAPRQLFGGDHHRQVLVGAAFAEPPVRGGGAEAERADLGDAGDDLFGHVAVRAMDVLGVRCDDVVGERAECVLHHLHVSAEVACALDRGERGDELWCAVGGQERTGRGKSTLGDAPVLLSAGETGL